LRFALTCRYVRPETMSNDQEREYTIRAAALPPGAEKYTYDGDINAQPVVKQNRIDPATDVFNMLMAKLRTGQLTMDQVRAAYEACCTATMAQV